MKKFLLIIFIILLIIVFLPEESKEFRIRVIAASNSVVDQRQKDEVVEALQKEIKKFNKDNIINEVLENIDLLERKVEDVLQDRAFSIQITKAKFPTKEIDGKVISGGRYETLLIVIDEGEGKNWWSILYPEYHNLSFEDINSGEVEFDFYFLDRIKNLFD